jgi:hypothetical protein
MKAVVNELMAVLPDERYPSLRQWQERLQSTIERSFTDRLDQLDASHEDRQGLGIPQPRNQ